MACQATQTQSQAMAKERPKNAQEWPSAAPLAARLPAQKEYTAVPMPERLPRTTPATDLPAHGDGEHEEHNPGIPGSGQGSLSADRQAACRPCLLSN